MDDPTEISRVHHRPGSSLASCCALVLTLIGAVPLDALAAGNCRFPKKPPVVLKNMAGLCGFDLGTLSFAGDPEQQALCLLNPVQPVGRLGEPLEKLPPALAERVGRTSGLPDREALRLHLRERNLGLLAEGLSRPVSHAHDNDPLSRSATYFLIHDTSSPNFRGLAWPKAIDENPKINNLGRYECANNIERAHIFINRPGAILFSHDFEVPWRATKFEMAVQHGSALKGLFLHVELIQPRRRLPGFGRSNDFLAPSPGFTPAQYDSLALVYAVTSLRAGFWLIPAFHAVIDEFIRDKHDDPQNFELDAFADSLQRLMDGLREQRASERRG